MSVEGERALKGHEIVSPPLPYDMRERISHATKDVRLQQFVNSATRLRDTGRVAVAREAFGERYDDLRRHAGEIKQHTLDFLDVYLDRWIERAQAAGVRVHYAADAKQANDICLAIAARNGLRRCVKAKSMVTEEIGLVPALRGAGIETVETDLGEFIIQLDDDAPSHIVAPMIHKDRRSVGRAFERSLGVPYTEDPEVLTLIARAHMREKFRNADLGISGANFLIADTGSLVLCTNEGNADLSVTAPGVHIAVVGVEKVIPSLAHLSVFVKLLARSATAQAMTIYTTILTGAKRTGDRDGPREMHVVLLDHGRAALLRDETRELLRCIRCGACLNACPVYRKVGGGHAYGAVYSGPIGAVLTPEMRGLHQYPDLPQASSLCGACFDACPVHIDIPAHLVRLRKELHDKRITPRGKRWMLSLWAWVLRGPRRYRGATALLRWVAGAITHESGGERWISHAPGIARGWTRSRDLLAPVPKSFRDWWRDEGCAQGDGGKE